MRKRSSFAGIGLLILGWLIVFGTAAAWMLYRAEDQIAIWNLPTPRPPDLPLAPTPAGSPSQTASQPSAAEATAIAELDALPTAPPPTAPPAGLPTLAILPTVDMSNLPSEASVDEAPKQLIRFESGHPNRLVIPALGIDAPVRDVGISSVGVDGDIFYQWQVPHNYAVGWHHTSAPLGQPGNTVLNGHHNIHGEIFRDLDEISEGDGILIYDDQEMFVYQVTQLEIVKEAGASAEQRQQNAQWIQPTLDERLTIVSCWPYSGNSHRLIVVAERVDS